MERKKEIIFFIESRLTPTFFLLLLLFNFSYAADRAKSHFLIVEKPWELIIYDFSKKYLSESEKNIFYAFSPFEIITEFDYFSDGVRSYAEVKYQGRIFYIERKSRNEFLNEARSGKILFLRNCEIYNDTVKFLDLVETKSFDKKKTLYAANGDLAIRIFKFGGEYYSINLKTKEYFVYSFPENLRNKYFEKFVPPRRDYKKEMKLREIESIIIEFDNKIKKAFNYINVKNKNFNSYPYWKIKKENYTLTAEFIVEENTRLNWQKVVNLLFEKLQRKIIEGEFTIYKSLNKIIIE